MSSYEAKLRQFAVELHKIDAIKFGEFKTKVGVLTPVYVDLRVIVSYPKMMEKLSQLIVQNLDSQKVDIICGVPYTALPIATVVSLHTGIPMVMRRKEPKAYGTKKLIEGKYNEGDKCLIIEDVVTSGSSVLEVARDLENSGIKCSEVIVLMNREQGGEDNLLENGIKMKALLKLTELIQILREENLIDGDTVTLVQEYLSKTRCKIEKVVHNEDRLKLPYKERVQYSKNKITSDLLTIMAEKETNLCVAADLTSATAILNLAENVGPYICCLKLHADIITDFNDNFAKCLREIAKNHNFLLFEDRKYADIGNTVSLQHNKGVFAISSWAKLVTAHGIFGKGVLDALQEDENLGVFLLAQGSSEGTLIDENYTKAVLNMASSYPKLVTGFVAQSPLAIDQPGFLQLTPGVQLNATGDNLGQKYNSPEVVVLEKGADIAVVGRGIMNAADQIQTAKTYRDLLWEAYMQRVIIE